jgi:hypothetical protein
MFGAITATGVVASAGSWSPAISSPVLLVVGLVVLLGVGAWVLSKFHGHAGE